MTLNPNDILGNKDSELSLDEAIALAQSEQVTTEAICQVANDIRTAQMGTQTSLCTIVNGRSGKCEEDCRFCAQSKYYATEIETYAMMSDAKILEAAREAEQNGVHCFSIVTSGGYLTEPLLQQLLPVYEKLKRETTLSLCASHGMLTLEQAQALKTAGVTTYHHNLETSRAYYPTICTSHSYDVRIETIKACQTAGLNVCSGGIMGLGESMADRMALAFELKALGIQSIPLNILMPIVGTPLAINAPLSRAEILRTIAMFRLIHPDAMIRVAGGRKQLGEDIEKALSGGLNALMVGNYLTTVGSNVADDIEMIQALGYQL